MSKPKIEPINAAGTETVDLSNLSALRLDQSFLESGGAKKILSTVPVRKPHPQHFIRVHPDPSFRRPFAVIDLKDDRERYLVTPSIAAALPTEIVAEMFYTAVTRQKVVFLWPVRMPAADGRINEWHRTAMEHAERAMEKWIRVTSNMELGAYEAIEASGNPPNPEWPADYTFDDLLRIGFRERIISSFEHPVLKRLRGECPSATSSSPTSSLNSAAMPVSGRARCAWWRKTYGMAKRGGCGAASLTRCRHSRSARIRCLLPITLPPSSAVPKHSAGQCRRTCSTCSSSFANLRNGLHTPAGFGLIGALTHFGLDSIGGAEKDRMQTLVLRGGPWSEAERAAILNYCAGDTVALERLLPLMLPRIDLPRALLRGRYMKAAAAMEWAGTPIDTDMLAVLRQHWTGIQDDLIQQIDADYGVFDGRTFKAERWERYLIAHGIPWPRLESGRLDLSDDAFRHMSRAHPQVSPMRELRSALSELRLNDLAVGLDGRNRTMLSVFRARTGRNQPSNTKFIFGPSVWLRSLIRPPPGHGVAYIDWSQQEFGIAAALSGDAAMQAAYRSGDPYLAFAKQAGAVPAGATKESHGPTRELFKQCVLAVQYGMEAESLAARIGQSPAMARDLLRAHHETYQTCWDWSDAALNHAMLHGSLHTVFGWTIHVGEDPNPRSLRNFPMKANGAEMLRLACCLATERGIEICAPIHDAVLICAPLDQLETDVAAMRVAMAEASRIVLDGFDLRTDVMRIRYPDRFQDPRGIAMWDKVTGLISRRPVSAIEAAA